MFQADPDAACTGKVRHLILIRHGQYELASDDHGLTKLGKEQSRYTGERLRKMAAGVKSDHYGAYKLAYDSIIRLNKTKRT